MNLTPAHGRAACPLVSYETAKSTAFSNLALYFMMFSSTARMLMLLSRNLNRHSRPLLADSRCCAKPSAASAMPPEVLAPRYLDLSSSPSSIESAASRQRSRGGGGAAGGGRAAGGGGAGAGRAGEGGT